jgi:predicted N-acetyltransferase YhbS
MIRIKHEAPEDISAIRYVNQQAFPTPDEAFMVKELRHGVLAVHGGVVNYRREFKAV